jgi:hypothetical protein
MAYIVIDSKFKPFNYDELVKPVQQATEAHIALEDKYGELAEKANIWEEMANQETDPQAYAMYKKYADDLQTQADLLASEGLTPGSRKSLLGMKARYSKEILPIEQAYARRKELADEQRKLRAQDNDLMFSTDYSTTSLDTLLSNPSAGYQSYSGKNLFEDSYKMASSIKQSMRSNEREWRDILGDDYYETVMQEGYSPEEILQVLSQDPRGSAVLKQIVEDVVNASGIKSWGDDATIKRAYDYTRKGLWGAAGKTTYTTLQNIKEKPGDNGNGGDKTTAPTRPAVSRTYFGAQGEVHPDVKALEGLKSVGEGKVSTNALDKAFNNYRDVVKKMKEKYTDEEIVSFIDYYETVSNLGPRDPFNPSKIQKAPDGYSDWYNNVIGAKKALETEQNKIAELIDKYSYLSSNPYDALTTGIKLLDMQSKQEYSTINLNIAKADYAEVREGISNIIGNIGNDVLEGEGGTGVYDENDNKVKKADDVRAIFADPDKLTFRITEGKEPQLQIMYEGMSYTIKGESNIDAVNRTLKEVNTFLSDYSKAGVDNALEIDNATYSSIFENGLSNTGIVGIKLEPLSKSSNFRYTVLHNTDSDDYIKVLFNNRGDVVAWNTLKDELRGGNMRGEKIEDIAISALLGLKSQVAINIK